MKPNEPHNWTIALYGVDATRHKNFRQELAVGDIEAALGAANELESEVDFEVVQYVIRRHEKVNT